MRLRQFSILRPKGCEHIPTTHTNYQSIVKSDVASLGNPPDTLNTQHNNNRQLLELGLEIII